MTLDHDGLQLDMSCSVPERVTETYYCDSCGRLLTHPCDPDSALLCRFAKHGDRVALDEFLIRHERTTKDAVRRTCHPGTLRDAIDDISQNVYMKIILGAAKFRCDGSAEAWVRGIAVNSTRDYFRPRGKVKIIYLESYTSSSSGLDEHARAPFSIEPLAPELTPADEATLEQRTQQLLQCAEQLIENLPEPLRTIVKCRKAGMTYEEIAAEVGTNPNTVGSRLYRARQLLLSQL